jgi:DNA-binding transcriptional LysR family regulator
MAGMRLRHIEVFNAIMLTGSISAAARLINVTQPAVSRTLQHAEMQLGFALFHRVKGRLTATTEALTLYPHIERLFTQLDEVSRLAASLRTAGGMRELRVVTVMALTHEIMPRALKACRAQQPGVAIRVEALHSPQIMSALLLREADIGFTFNPAVHPGLSQERLADSHMVCVAPRGLLPKRLTAHGRVALTDLASVPMIGLDSQDPVGLCVSQACREAEVGLRHVITVQTYHAALALAHHGLGAALVDACTALSADRDKLDVVTLEAEIPVPISALRLAQQADSVATKGLVTCMKEALSTAG